VDLASKTNSTSSSASAGGESGRIWLRLSTGAVEASGADRSDLAIDWISSSYRYQLDGTLHPAFFFLSDSANTSVGAVGCGVEDKEGNTIVGSNDSLSPLSSPFT
jgi:hypothetical protein